MIVKENFSLKNFNTFKIDVSARFYAELESAEQIFELTSQKEFQKLPVLILGEGSNILFTKNYDGIVVKLISKGIKVVDENAEFVFVNAQAGESWDDLVTFCVDKEYYGIENLSLIPGTVGAAPIQNIGAYGVELKDVLESVEGFNLETKEKVTFQNKQCRFGYRNSVFKNELKNKFLISNITLKLKKEKSFDLNYRAFQDFVQKKKSAEIIIKEVSDLVKRIRMSKLPDPSKLGNAGSFFKNPEVDNKKFSELKKTFSDLVFFKVDEHSYKIPAGWLIEKCGFKGKKSGKVGTYNKQALVIVNFGSADGIEIVNFAEQIVQAVHTKFGIKLTPEVNII
ncbi:MAG: UDP-N-acetylmuramate dehydrogenase [Bacteroidetes bacterium]|nr:UDP-N-acetylmuramate dehydrogenase [Bacteroidota bacterium]